ncbi:MAG: glycosyltransferase family 39 protein [Nitrospiraceae bacterium]|nr:glycosyltransferase family 39 protein [Nitrospiraceae bacterium]
MSPGELDTSLFFAINRGLQNSFFDNIMPFMTNRGMFLCLPFIAWAAFKEKKKILPYILLSIVAVGVADGSGNVLKHLIGRVRPCAALENVHLLAGCGPSASMPSNHALNSFAFALVFWPLGRTALTVSLACIAAVVAFSRIYIGVHYPGDVLAGVLLGAAAAWSTLFVFRRGQRIWRDRAYDEGLFLLLAALSLFRVYYMITGPFEILPDEAHYWEWSRRLDWGYYSKGPLIAYIIYAGTHLFGNTEFGVRFFAMVLSALSSLVLFILGRRLYDDRTGFVAALLVQIVPLYSVFGFFMTIDSPFIFFWILSLYLFWRAYEAETGSGGEGALLQWGLLGLSIGFGMLAKHLIALFYVSGFLFLLSRAEGRRILRRPGPYLAFAAGLALFSPVVFWNAAHGWVTFKHTAGQAHLYDGFTISPMNFVEYIGSQIGLVTPVLFFMILIALWRLRKDARGAFLFWFAAPTLVFFGLKSIQGKVQGNWALAAYATGFIAFAAYYAKGGSLTTKKEKRRIGIALIVALVVTVFAHVPQLIPLPPDRHPMRKITGWKELAGKMSVIRKEMSSDGPVFVFSDTYQDSSRLAFYMDGHPVTYCLDLKRRKNQYDLWPGMENVIGQNAIFTGRKDTESVLADQAYLARAFDRCEKQEVEIPTRLHVRVKYDVYKCYHFNGFQPEPEESY